MITKLAALAAVMGLAVGSALTAGGAMTAPASARTAEPSPGAAYLNGLDLHTASGRVVHVPLSGKYEGYTTLLGRGPTGWVIIAGDFHYYLLAHGKATRLALADSADKYVRHILSADGGLIWESAIDQAGDLRVSASDLTGHGAGGWELDSQYGELLAADGDHAWIGGKSLVELVRKHDSVKAQTIQVDQRRADLADSRRDIAFFHEKGGDGPTSLSSPGALAWHAPFLPLTISGQGTYVAGLKGDNTVEIRRMSDGSLVRDLGVKYDYDAGDELGWAGATVVRFDVEGKHRTYALEQCEVLTGHCGVVTPWSKYQYSLPDSIHEWV